MAEPIIIPPLKTEGVIHRPLERHTVPRHIVVLRFHAFGDTIITLPLLAGLRDRFPEAQIDFVTSHEYVELFAALPILDNVWPVTTRGNRLQQLSSILPLRSQLHRPDVVLDLQRSRLSGILVRLLSPSAYCRFDRYARKHALDRYLEAVTMAQINGVEPIYAIPFQEQVSTATLEHTGLAELSGPLVCLNPAGCWGTKNWPPERYAELGAWLIRDYNARIVLLGTANVQHGADIIKHELAEDAINLVGKTTPLEALAIIRKLSLVVSDDSGLMHLAWTNGVPTIGIFGASRSVWSRPRGPHTRHLGSEDLSCGSCMSPNCLRNDRICLARISVEQVFSLCQELLGKNSF